MIVDVSAKPDVARYAEAVAQVPSTNPGACQVGARAAIYAHRYIPLLHPIPLNAEALCTSNSIIVRTSTTWSTGVEMDALFGALIAAVLSARSFGPVKILAKVKGGETPAISSTEIAEAGLGREEGAGYAVAEALLKLRDPSSLFRAEKGDPIWLAKAAAALMSKRLCELVKTECALISHVRVDVEPGEETYVKVLVKARNLVPIEDAMAATAAAVATIWDVVKKFEKDENGQYPHTEIRFVRAVEWGRS